MRTQVGIVGAGPAGLLLSPLLHLEGVDSVVLKLRGRDHVEQRVRLDYLATSEAAARSLAENYVGLERV